MSRPVVHHIPVCPLSQRLEILLALRGRRDKYASDAELGLEG